MSITLAELKALLEIDEPDYAALAVMAAGAMTHLRKLAASSDVSLASKAVSLAGMIGGTSAVSIVTSAAGSNEVLVRLAAAHAVGFLPDHAKVSEVIQGLLADDDLGVVKVAATAASAQGVRSAAVNVTAASKRIKAATRLAAKPPAKKAAAAVRAAAAVKPDTSTGGMPTGEMSEPSGKSTGGMPTGKM